MGAAAFVVKLVSAGSLFANEIGRERLFAEVGPISVPGWFAADASLALGWGLGAGLTLGWMRNRIVAHSVLGLLHAAVAILLAGVALVYVAFGAVPSWGLLHNLGNLGDAQDSFVALVSGPPLLLLGALLMLLVVGAPLLERILRARPGLCRRCAMGLAVLAAALLTTRAASQPSALELDRNGMVEFFASALEPRRPITSSSRDLREVLRPQSPAARPNAAAATAYHALARWAQERPRNIVIAILESMPAGQLQITGGPDLNTPEMARLARSGLLWPRLYAHTPNSMFAIYALLGANHGQPGGPPISEARPRIACRSLPEVLVERGYAASLWHSGRFSYYKKDLFLSARGFDPMHDAVTMPGADRHKKTSWGIREEPTIDALLQWVRSQATPWLAVYVSVYPHHPYDVPPGAVPGRAAGGGRAPRFRHAARYIDAMVGRLADGMRAAGVQDDTLLLVLGDHGEGFGEHPGSTLHGTTLYEEGARTFALWNAPGAFRQASVDDRPFGHVDITPTLLDGMGVAVPGEHPGTPAPRVERPMVPLYTGNGVHMVGFVDGRYKFIHRIGTGVSELYDLSRDPAERRSIAAWHRDRLATYRERALAFVAAQHAWETRLPDLGSGPHPAAPAQRAEHWTIDPKDCEHPARDFVIDGGTLRPARPGFLVATCARVVPAAGRVTALRARAREALNGSQMWISLQWLAPDGSRREVAYCQINGNSGKPATGCEASLVGGRTGFGAGGQLVAELQYDLKGRPAAAADFSVTAVETSYVFSDSGSKETSP